MRLAFRIVIEIREMYNVDRFRSRLLHHKIKHSPGFIRKLKTNPTKFQNINKFLKPSNCLKLNQHYQKIFMPRFRSILENHISRNLKQIFPAEFRLPLQEVGHGNSNLTEIRITKLKELTYSLGGNSEEPESMNEVLYLHVS